MPKYVRYYTNKVLTKFKTTFKRSAFILYRRIFCEVSSVTIGYVIEIALLKCMPFMVPIF